MLDLAAIGKRIRPARPRLDAEFANAIGAVLAYEIGCVALRGQRDIMPAGFYPRLETVDQNHSSARRCGRGKQNRRDSGGCEFRSPCPRRIRRAHRPPAILASRTPCRRT